MNNANTRRASLRVRAWLAGLRHGLIHRSHSVRQRQLLGRLHYGEILLEIAPGTARSFEHYPPAATVYAVEPDPAMHAHIEAAARRRALHLRLLPSFPESLPLDDNSVDVAVASMALHAVNDRVAVLAEIRRVLRPGGRFVFVERGAVTSSLEKFRKRLRRSRQEESEPSTEELMKASGFSRMELEQLVLRSWGLLRWKGVAGYAVK